MGIEFMFPFFIIGDVCGKRNDKAICSLSRSIEKARPLSARELRGASAFLIKKGTVEAFVAGPEDGKKV